MDSVLKNEPMTRHQDSEDRHLADRLVNYSDAIVALAFLASSGLGLAVADPDTRHSVTAVAGGMMLGNAILGVIFSGLLMVLRRWEMDLRSEAVLTEKVQKYSQYIYIARHSMVWLTVSQTVAIMWLI
jgi:hypothetical protein